MIINSFVGNKKKQYVLGLLLKEEEGIAILIDTSKKIGNLVDFIHFNYSDGWEKIIEDVDEVLYRLENKNNTLVDKVIFFLYSHLIDEKDGNIKPPYQNKIKSIAKELELKPLGYINCRDAVINIVESKDNNPLTAHLIELDKNKINYFLYKSGQLEYNNLIPRTNDFVDHLISVLKDIKEKLVIPTRIILYDASDLDRLVTDILSYNWPKEIFFQLPRVEIIKQEEILSGLINLFIDQLRANLVDKKLKEEEEDKKEIIEGFIIDGDIKEEKDLINKKKEGFRGFSFMFLVNNFFTKISSFKLLSKKNDEEKFLTKDSGENKIRLNFILTTIGIGIFLFSIFLNEILFHKAEIKIYPVKKEITKELIMSLEDLRELSLIKEVNNETELTVAKKTTGSKEIGEQSKGKVTFFNFDKEVVVPKGTEIKIEDKVFITQEEVKVASASFTSDNSAKLPGKASVAVVASKIGEEYNLKKGSVFTIDDYDKENFFAKNEEDFSGGRKKVVTTVSKTDYSDLEKLLLEKAKKTKLPLRLTEGENIISDLTKYEIIKKNYSKKIDEEAENLTLEGIVQITYYLYSKKALTDYFKKDILKDLTSNFQLDKSSVSFQFRVLNPKEEKKRLRIILKGKSYKEIEKGKVLNSIKGKNTGYLDKFLRKDLEVASYSFEHKQPLFIPYYRDFLPFFQKNINIKIE